MILLLRLLGCFGVFIWGIKLQYNSKRVRHKSIYNLDEFLAIQPSVDAYKAIKVLANETLVSIDHPVIKAVVDRWEQRSLPGRRAPDDDKRIALCMEGGGMRGCVAAGSAAAIHFLGLNDAIDVVYGSSAGSMVAAYFVSRQFSGTSIYYGKERNFRKLYFY